MDDLKHQLNPISEQVNQIKKNELLYRKAFTRRCLNLQIAEEEVRTISIFLFICLCVTIHFMKRLLHYFTFKFLLSLAFCLAHFEILYKSNLISYEKLCICEGLCELISVLMLI